VFSFLATNLIGYKIAIKAAKLARKNKSPKTITNHIATTFYLMVSGEAR
jgi:hypothetical protein